MYENLKDFGEDCAIDGKFLDTYASKNHTNKCNDNRAEVEGCNGFLKCLKDKNIIDKLRIKN